MVAASTKIHLYTVPACMAMSIISKWCNLGQSHILFWKLQAKSFIIHAFFVCFWKWSVPGILNASKSNCLQLVHVLLMALCGLEPYLASHEIDHFSLFLELEALQVKSMSHVWRTTLYARQLEDIVASCHTSTMGIQGRNAEQCTVASTRGENKSVTMHFCKCLVSSRHAAQS